MATLEKRLEILETAQCKASPALVLIFNFEQSGVPTTEQAAQIEQAERQGRQVRTITIIAGPEPAPVADVAFRGYGQVKPLSQKRYFQGSREAG